MFDVVDRFQKSSVPPLRLLVAFGGPPGDSPSRKDDFLGSRGVKNRTNLVRLLQREHQFFKFRDFFRDWFYDVYDPKERFFGSFCGLGASLQHLLIFFFKKTLKFSSIIGGMRRKGGEGRSCAEHVVNGVVPGPSRIEVEEHGGGGMRVRRGAHHDRSGRCGSAWKLIINNVVGNFNW